MDRSRPCSTQYADHLAREDEDDDGLFDAHVKVAALAQVDGVSEELDREADELGKKWLGKYRVAIKGLTDERRAVYDEIKGMSPEPQVIEIKRPRIRTEETENADGNKLETRTGHLMSDGDGNFPIGSLNQWEIEVLDKEMGRSGFQAWYRNPPHPSGDALAIAYQNAQGHWRRMCPDFLFFHGDSENMKVSIVDPPRPPPRRRASQAARLGRVRRHARSCFPPHRIGRADEGWRPACPGPHRSVHPRCHHRS